MSASNNGTKFSVSLSNVVLLGSVLYSQSYGYVEYTPIDDSRIKSLPFSELKIKTNTYSDCRRHITNSDRRIVA